MRQLHADVAVVAAGLSGLAAAIAAAEGGASVIALEKAATTGGAANMAMGPLGIGSRIQKQNMIGITPFEAFRKHMNFVHWRVDARTVRDYYLKAGDTIAWLEGMGVEFVGAVPAYSAPENVRAYATSEATWHVVKPAGGGAPGPRAAAAMVTAMTGRAAELGVEVLLSTPAQRLLVEDGAVVGVVGRDDAGEEVEVRAAAVVVATGGFGANPRMLKEFTGYAWGEDLFSFAIPGMVGDGLRMAWEAGAGSTPVTLELMYQIPDNLEHFCIEGAFRQPCLWVNRRGERFMNEDGIQNTTFTGNAISCQPGHVGYAIMDAKLLRRYKRNGGDLVSHVHPHDLYQRFDDELAAAEASGYEHVARADSLEELADRLGIDPEGLLETVDAYNEDCDAGYDSLFDKSREFMQPIAKGPFYGLRMFPGAYGTLGGIRTNHRMEAVTDGHEPVPGLYAAGVDACAIYGDSYPFILPGNTMGFCLNSGRIAGENAAERAAAAADLDG